MSVQIFRGGMNHEVETELDRTLDPRTGESVVGDGNDFVLPRSFRDRFQIDEFQQRVAWRLDPDHARVLFDCAFEPGRVGKIDISEIETGGAPANFFEKPKCPAVKVIANDDMRTAVEQIERGRHRGESGRKREA